MKLWILSDLHRDFTKPHMPIPRDAEVAVVAGDVCDDEWLISLGNTLPTVYVCGNHCFYGKEYPSRLADLRALPAEQFYLLENETLVLGDVRFIGATLWTDYNGRDPIAMDLARRRMNDHRKITWQKEPWMRFRPEEAAQLHFVSRRYISSELAKPFDGKTVVLTHHAPSERSVAPKYAGDLLNHAYFSALDAEIETWKPHLWVHGHTHTCFDYMIGETRVVCNPHGYPGENAAFDPQMVVEI